MVSSRRWRASASGPDGDLILGELAERQAVHRRWPDGQVDARARRPEGRAFSVGSFARSARAVRLWSWPGPRRTMILEGPPGRRAQRQARKPVRLRPVCVRTSERRGYGYRLSTSHGRQTPHRTKLQVAVFITLLILAAIGVVLLVRNVLPGSSSSSGVRGSGVAATSTRALANFSGIDLAGSNNVTVVAGARQSVVVHADTNLLSHVTTQVKAGKLIIGDIGSFAAKSPMYVEVSVPSLAALDLSGSGNITVTGIRASRLTVTLSGDGNIYASGSATRLNVSIDGSGNCPIQRSHRPERGRRRHRVRHDLCDGDTEPGREGAGRRRGPLQRQSPAGNIQHHRQRSRDTRLSSGATPVTNPCRS